MVDLARKARMPWDGINKIIASAHELLHRYENELCSTVLQNSRTRVFYYTHRSPPVIIAPLTMR